MTATDLSFWRSVARLPAPHAWHPGPSPGAPETAQHQQISYILTPRTNTSDIFLALHTGESSKTILMKDSDLLVTHSTHFPCLSTIYLEKGTDCDPTNSNIFLDVSSTTVINNFIYYFVEETVIINTLNKYNNILRLILWHQKHMTWQMPYTEAIRRLMRVAPHTHLDQGLRDVAVLHHALVVFHCRCLVLWNTDQ